MLWKLLKYDFRAMWKQFALVWGAALVLAAVNRFTMDGRYSTSLVGENVSDVVLVALLSVLTAMFVVCLIFVNQRFYRGLLGSEGYLMHTLPVRPWQLVVSKLICAIAAFCGCMAVGILAMLVMFPVDWREIFNMPLWRVIFRGLAQNMDTVAYLGEICLLLLTVLILGCAALYLSMSVGQLFHRRRGLISGAAFIAVYIAVNFYGSWMTDRFYFDLSSHTGLWTAMGMLLLPAAVMLAGTCWILEHKLNLE